MYFLTPCPQKSETKIEYLINRSFNISKCGEFNADSENVCLSVVCLGHEFVLFCLV